VNALCRDAAAAALSGEAAPSQRLGLDPTLTSIETDGERLRTVLVNVLSNAREAVLARGNDAGPPAPAVELRTEALSGGRCAIVVTDHGVGIAPEDVARVFEPYFTTKRTGTGLGLAIVRNVIDAMGGSIAVESRSGEGTQVRIELPARPRRT
jgi:two-component system sensor histidine kinase AtoS